MTESGDTTARGRRSDALFALAWVGLGFSHIASGNLGVAVGFIVLGILQGSTFFWPGSAIDRFLSAPIIRRKRPADR